MGKYVGENSNTDTVSFIDYGKIPLENVFEDLKSKEKGLTNQEAKNRLKKFGRNEIISKDEKGLIALFFSKISSPLVVVLILISAISIILKEHVGAIIILSMALLSIILSIIQEHNANQNAKKLSELVKVKTRVLRSGKIENILVSHIVPGDIIELTVGKLIPADMRIISAKNLHVNQSALNGESFPARKNADFSEQTSGTIYETANLAFMGSNVVSGTGKAITINTGKNTEFGKLSHELGKIKTVTAFDKGINKFTWLMIKLIFVLTTFIFIINTLVKGNVIESLFFSLAIAIGLAPEMLPMLVAINLSKGAIAMAKKNVIIKELDSIQNFGAMDILATDKTGTLTLNKIVLVEHCDALGHENEEILRLAYMNSFFQTGLDNLLDKAIIDHKKFPTSNIKKIDEIPFDFSRRIMSVIIYDNKNMMISKGAPEDIIKISKYCIINQKKDLMTADIKKKLNEKYNDFSKNGFRVLAIAYKNITPKAAYSKDDENDLIFVGFTAFLDPPKPTVQKTVSDLKNLGVKLIILTGDNELVTKKIASEVKLDVKGVLNGSKIDQIDDKDLSDIIERYNLFTRMSPSNKERVIKALQKNNHIVGFLGDGINDAPSLKTSDVGISVDNAVDIAKETAQIILLEKDLTILGDTITEGRKVYVNIIKYIKMGASSNFGNMLSMTGASIFLPFLPMLPTQILLNNFLYDMSQVSIPTDEVDSDSILKPRPWNIDFIEKFIIYIGPISSIFDFITYGIMWFVFKAYTNPSLFQTGWFIESLCTQILIVHIIRTDKIPFIESKPSKALLLTTIGIVLLSWVMPYSVLAKYFGFTPLPFNFFLILIVISIVYLLITQMIKKWFIKKFE
jgi:Mg2+-importing ATPase